MLTEGEVSLSRAEAGGLGVGRVSQPSLPLASPQKKKPLLPQKDTEIRHSRKATGKGALPAEERVQLGGQLQNKHTNPVACQIPQNSCNKIYQG